MTQQAVVRSGEHDWEEEEAGHAEEVTPVGVEAEVSIAEVSAEAAGRDSVFWEEDDSASRWVGGWAPLDATTGPEILGPALLFSSPPPNPPTTPPPHPYSHPNPNPTPPPEP